MISPRISPALRRAVRERAKGYCEYCLLPEAQAYFPHEPDHIIATKHGGPGTIDNLAWACFDCNRFKGSDIASIDSDIRELTQIFNPRTQEWSAHFSIDGGVIRPQTAIGRVSVIMLKLNLPSRVEVRETLASVGHYPKP